MKKLNVLTFGLILTISGLASAQSKRILPLPSPEVVCTSIDQSWELLLNLNLGIIRVVDIAQNRLSHKVTGLRNDSRNNLAILFNFKGKNGLPEGTVFYADLKVAGKNAYGIDDVSGKKTFYSCRRN